MGSDVEQAPSPGATGDEVDSVGKGEEQAEPAPDAGSTPPFDHSFAPLKLPFTFWQDLLLLLLLGAGLGAFGYGYLKAVTEVSELLLQADGNPGFPADPAASQFGAGRAWWVGAGAGVGLAVGLSKAALRLDTAPTFIHELQEMHVDPIEGLKIAFCALLGLMGGAPLGPEAGLGALAGGVGTFVGERLRTFSIEAQMRRRLYTLSAMCSCFAALLPSPLVAVLLTMELGRQPSTWGIGYMHLIIILSAGGAAAWVVYYAIATQTYIPPLAYALADKSLENYDQFYIVAGILFGIMGAALGLAYILIAAVVKKVLGAARQALDARVGQWLRVVILCTLGGAAYGALGWAMPLTLTDGSKQLVPILQKGGEIGSSVLAASCFAKALSFFLCIECGFHGGMVMPMLSMSCMLGRIFMNITGVNPVVAQSCSLIALPASLMPGPFFLCVLSVSVMIVGTKGLVPVFVTACTAHLLFLGIGVPQALLAATQRGKERRAKRAAARAARRAAAATEGEKAGGLGSGQG